MSAEEPLADRDQLLTLAAEIVSAHPSNNAVAPDQLPTLVQQVFNTLATVGQKTVEPLWCMKAWPVASVRRVEYHRIRTETGMPKLVIRLSTLHPIFASVH